MNKENRKEALVILFFFSSTFNVKQQLAGSESKIRLRDFATIRGLRNTASRGVEKIRVIQRATPAAPFEIQMRRVKGQRVAGHAENNFPRRYATFNGDDEEGEESREHDTTS